TLLIVLTCALVVGGVNWFTRKTDEPKDPNAEKDKDKDKDKPPIVIVQPEKRYPIYPDHWKPVEKDGSRLIGDRHYHYARTRKAGDRELTAYLIYPTASSHPDPFYMLEHKVTNKVFNDAWEEVVRGGR